MFVQGHASNSITRIPESMKGLAGLELLVVADPHPTTWASLAVQAGRKDNTYLLPVCTQFEPRDRGSPPTERSSGASRSSPQASSRRTIIRSCTCFHRSLASPNGCSRTSPSKVIGRYPRTCCVK